MSSILTILAVAFLWAFLNGEASTFNLFVGGLLGMLLLSILQREQTRSFPMRVVAIVRFVVQFVAELLVANAVIAMLAFRPRPRFHPHIIAVPLRVESDFAISLLSAAITLLPGTVAMGVSSDRAYLYAHAIGAADPDDSRASVTRIESLILGFMN